MESRHGLLWPASFSQPNVFKVHPHCCSCPCFLPLQGWVIFPCMDRPRCFICLPADGRLRHLLCLAAVNIGAVNTHLEDSVWIYTFNSLEHILSSRVAGSYVNSVSFSGEPPNCFPWWLHYFPFHQQRSGPPVSPHPHLHLLYSGFWLQPFWWVWICISLMTYDVEHLFKCLLSIFISSLEKWLFKSFAQF